MYCGTCGERIKNGEKICPFCGSEQTTLPQWKGISLDFISDKEEKEEPLELSLIHIYVDYDIEAFSNEGYGAFIMQNLAEAMGEEGVYTTMVASLTNGSHNEWADAAVEYQKEHYPNMTLLEENPRVESDDNGCLLYTSFRRL